MEFAGAHGEADASILSRLIAPFAGAEALAIAQRLMDRFRTLSDLFGAQPDDVREAVSGRADIAAKIALFSELVARTSRGRPSSPHCFHTPEDVINAVAADMLKRRCETLRVLFLGGDNRLLSDDIMAEGSVSSLVFHPREIIRRALEVDASAMIMVHNHPSASPMPSAEDIRATQQTGHLSAALDIRLHDHLVISSQGWRSMRADGHVL